jgi:hypothetical protein
MLGGGVRFCQWSVTSLRLGFPGGTDDAEATTLQRNNFSQFLLVGAEYGPDTNQ